MVVECFEIFILIFILIMNIIDCILYFNYRREVLYCYNISSKGLLSVIMIITNYYPKPVRKLAQLGKKLSRKSLFVWQETKSSIFSRRLLGE